ncbi:hypothetical protein [Demequina aurantiaca]|uniref:hypothetical protein n=1 Tax=Demequina aurantiaca TaxID=676200 RepID=UPI0007804A09|nr:hypothetical protein [Demequina aurantiaca]
MTDQERSADSGTSELSEPRAPMSYGERYVWAQGLALGLSGAAYLAVVIPRAIAGPIADVSWVTPMLWAIGAGIVGTIALTILIAIGSEVSGAVGVALRSSLTGRTVEREAPVHEEDVRDRDIGAYGDRHTMYIMSCGALGALVLAMLDADTFWIGNALFVLGLIATLWGCGVKIRAYRRGF